MGKWVAIIGVTSAIFLYDPQWAIQTVDYWLRWLRM
jgi:hypothetical protein